MAKAHKRIWSARLTKLRPKLNDREIKTLTWAARGMTSTQIAQRLGMVKRTVDFHIDNARIKLGAATRSQAAVRAATLRLIEPY
jgi:DNA-binding CsgD family transcriptional regulator